MERNRIESLRHAFAFLSTRKVISDNHLTKSDVKEIKNLANQKIGLLSLFIGVILFIVQMIILANNLSYSGGKPVELYGIAAILGHILSTTSALLCVILTSIAIFNKKKRHIFNRIGIDIMFFGMTADIILSLFADCQQGFITVGLGISPSILLIIFILLLQQSHLIEAYISDLLFTIAFIVSVIICIYTYDLVNPVYYFLLAILFIPLRYLIRSFLFYAEVQRYCQQLSNEKLYNKANYDELTGCKNRYALSQYITKNTPNWAREESNILIAMFDIDDFKIYNDSFSHIVGDYCLKMVSDAVRKEFPYPDLNFFRYGGEEFLLIFELEPDDNGNVILERIRNSIKDLQITNPEGSKTKYVTVSVGGTVIKVKDDFSFDEEMKNVDSYLYMVKNNGKNNSCLDGKILN